MLRKTTPEGRDVPVHVGEGVSPNTPSPAGLKVSVLKLRMELSD